jgi:hypothetical protein
LGWRAPTHRSHAFIGANLFGIHAVMAADVARANAHADAFALALECTEKLLQSAVTVEILSAPASVTPGADILVEARIENASGHGTQLSDFGITT